MNLFAVSVKEAVTKYDVIVWDLLLQFIVITNTRITMHGFREMLMITSKVIIKLSINITCKVVALNMMANKLNNTNLVGEGGRV